MKALYEKHREMISYLFFGVATTLVNWIAYTICTKGFGLDAEGLEMTLSNGIAWVVAVAFAFVTNKRYVFESKCRTRGQVLAEAVKFVGARVFSGIFEVALPTVLVKCGLKQTLFGIAGAAAKAVTSVLVIVLNYVLSKLIVFRKVKETEEVSCRLDKERENEEHV